MQALHNAQSRRAFIRNGASSLADLLAARSSLPSVRRIRLFASASSPICTRLDSIERVFATIQAPRHYVIGNHCVDTLTKAEFAAHTGAAKTPHYSFDHTGWHFVILDACYRSDGEPYGRKNSEWQDANVPLAQLDWLRADLAKTTSSTIVCAHQRLDVAGQHCIRNAEAVRVILEQSGRTFAVFQGHSHKNDYQQIRGLHYVTLAAMIEGSGAENSSYSVLEIMPDRSLRLRGFRRQENRELRSA